MPPIDSLRRYPLFSLLGDRGLAAWLAASRELAVEPGQTLTRTGQPGRYAYLVLDGKVRVVSHTEEGREVALGLYGPGEVFGEYALLHPGLDTATCRASGVGRVIRLPLDPLRGTLAGSSGVGDTLKNWLRLHALATHLRGGAFLGFMSAPSVLPLLDRCAEETYQEGQTVQASGLCNESWFFVKSGAVVLDPGAAPREVHAGDSFGERALYARRTLSHAVVRGTAKLLRLSREEFVRPLSGDDPSILQTVNPARADAPKAFEWVPQREATDCGAAALAMAAQGVGVRITREQVAAKLATGDRGVSLEGLAHAAEHLGLTATPARVPPLLLDRVRPPAVIHLAEGHYVALLAAQPGQVVLGDPTRGILTWRTDQLASAGSGVVLLLGSPRTTDRR